MSGSLFHPVDHFVIAARPHEIDRIECHTETVEVAVRVGQAGKDRCVRRVDDTRLTVSLAKRIGLASLDDDAVANEDGDSMLRGLIRADRHGPADEEGLPRGFRSWHLLWVRHTTDETEQ